MFEEETKELKMSNEFRKKIGMICKFACVKYELINGNIISISCKSNNFANSLYLFTKSFPVIP